MFHLEIYSGKLKNQTMPLLMFYNIVLSKEFIITENLIINSSPGIYPPNPRASSSPSATGRIAGACKKKSEKI